LNRVSVSASLTEREALRYTPAGVPVVQFKVVHRSVQAQPLGDRVLELELSVLATELMARRMDQVPLGSELLLHGFLAPRRRNSAALVLHLTGFESLSQPPEVVERSGGLEIAHLTNS